MKADYYMGDIYPNLSYFSTKASTIPEPADQTSLIDNPDTNRTATTNPIDVAPEKHNSILFSVGAIFLIIVLLGIRF
jgi:hypothetical protein